MAYVLISDQGALTSWGSGNQNATILAAITPARATLDIVENVANVSALGTAYESFIPNLKSVAGSIGGYIGSAPYIGAIGIVAFSSGGYALHVTEAEVSIRTTTAHDITELNAGSQWMRFRPGTLTWSIRYTAMIDSGTAIVAPPDTGASLPTVTLTYGSGATVAGAGVIRQVGVAIVRGNKQLVTYEITGTGTLTTAGGIFGTSTLGSTHNTAPIWNAGGSATGAMVITAASGRTYSMADSFWTGIRLRVTPNAPASVDISWQGDGAVTIG